ncbi:hypothetical protein LZ30DRAFT_743311 [Colletotrichum cereale]|nr:hypothetical protein LZ30DRAFT_743311 [Colletotrichum cereale]
MPGRTTNGIARPAAMPAVLNERKAAAKAIRFMEQTEILGQFRIESQPRQS